MQHYVFLVLVSPDCSLDDFRLVVIFLVQAYFRVKGFVPPLLIQSAQLLRECNFWKVSLWVFVRVNIRIQTFSDMKFQKCPEVGADFRVNLSHMNNTADVLLTCIHDYRNRTFLFPEMTPASVLDKNLLTSTWV